MTTDETGSIHLLVEPADPGPLRMGLGTHCDVCGESDLSENVAGVWAAGGDCDTGLHVCARCRDTKDPETIRAALVRAAEAAWNHALWVLECLKTGVPIETHYSQDAVNITAQRLLDGIE